MILTVFLSSGCKRTEKVVEPVELIPVAESAIKDVTSVYYRDFSDYSPIEFSKLPVGVFDSGTGGLNVVEQILTMDSFDNITGKAVPDGIPDFAGEDLQYLDDYANMPYSTYVSEGESDYLRELVVKDALFLTGEKYYLNDEEDHPTGFKKPVKLVVVACNTASAVGMKDITNMFKVAGCKVKVMGVIEAGVRAAVTDMKENGRYAVGIMSNSATLSSEIYQKNIADSAAARKCSVDIVTKDCEGLDEAINNGSDSIEILARRNFRELVDGYLKSDPSVPMKCVILGSTHYPYLKKVLGNELAKLRNTRIGGRAVYRELLADNFKFVDPSEYTAKECYMYLRENKLLALNVNSSSLESFISVPSSSLSTDCLDSNGDLNFDFKYGRHVGTEEVTTKQVPFSRRYISEEALLHFQSRIPRAYSLIVKNLN